MNAGDKTKGKQKSTRDVTFVSGGNHSMFGKSGVGPQKPGVSATTRHGPTGKMKAVRGGSTKMFGKSGVKALKPA